MTIPAQQADVAAFLTRLSGTEPKETPISAVFVGTDTAWKLKKAVHPSFLDFSTPDRRRHFLERELAINQPSAPALYRDVVAVGRRADGSLGFDGDPVDWVLRMTPVAADDFLDVVAARGVLPPLSLDQLGDCVAAYHARLPPVVGWDSATRLAQIAEGNMTSALAAGLPTADVLAWRDRCLLAIDALRPWLLERATGGFVRRCHGDLHLGNLCLWKGTPTPFDALEFDEALATIDTFYDLAFLLMDVDQRVGRAAANRVMNRYVARSGDAAGMRGLPMFLSQRAMIRAHVMAAMGQDVAARTLLEATLAYLSPAHGHVMAIGGLQGSGKTTLARALAPSLAPAPGALVLRSDEIRKRLFGKAPEERLPPEAYAEAVNVRVNRLLIEQVCLVAAGGHAVIADSTFLDGRMRADLAAGVAGVNVGFTGIWLQAPLAVLEQRIARRELDASDATVAVLRQSAQRDSGANEWLAVDASDGGAALEAVRSAVADGLAERDATRL